MFSLCAGWAPKYVLSCLYYILDHPPVCISAADFNCRLPATTCPAKIFLLTSLGVLLPVMFTVILGALLMTVPAYVEAYGNGEVAGVLSRGASCLCYNLK